MNKILPFQKEAIQKIIQFYNSNSKNASISISTGLGGNKILIYAIDKILSNNNCKILFLCSTESQVVQFQEHLRIFSNSINVVKNLANLKTKGVLIDSYSNIRKATKKLELNYFDLIIFNDLDSLNDENLFLNINREYMGKRLNVFRSKNLLIKNEELIFEYNLSQALNEGYISTMSEQNFLDDFLSLFLQHLNFNNITINNAFKNYRIDATALYNNTPYIFEIKTYRTKYIPTDLIENSCSAFFSLTQKYKNAIPVIIIPSVIDRQWKEKFLEETKIEIWDISNLIFLCNQSQGLLHKLISYVSFPTADIKPEKPLLFKMEKREKIKKLHPSYYQKFESQLANCLPGKDDQEDKKFEKICTTIITYLFGTEFFQMSTQHKTDDDLFKMDLICSLKGTTEFWKFLMQFYNTKFVVFEYKNYTEKLSQNLVFITSKYLLPEALRNVAFIVSRQGFNKNAQLVANSKIKSDKKLIISLTDKDLLIMVAAKEQGKDPSDYLLEKVEKTLMALSVY